MLKTYDTVILGCGEAGVFAGYELIHRNPGMKVLIVEQGQDIYHRSCPIVAGKVKSCIDCKVCHTMCGFGGAGAFSDGKYNFTTAFGGWLTDFIPEKEVMDLIDYVDEINTAHGATREVFSTNTPEAQALRKRALESDLHLLAPSRFRLCTMTCICWGHVVSTWAPRTTCVSSRIFMRTCGRTSTSSSIPPSRRSVRPRAAISWRPPMATSTSPSISSQPPAAPGPSGLPTNVKSWACP